MKAIILAAGEGKRLRPLTNDIPKCLVNLFGKSLLERQIEILRKKNIENIIVISGYQKEKIKIKNIKEYHNKDYESTNMLETLFCAEKGFDESLIISYGDIIFEENILESLIESKEEFSVIVDLEWKKYWMIRMEDPTKDVESLKMNSKGFITDIGLPVKDVSEIQGQYIGLMKFQNEALEIIREFYKKCKEEAEKTGVNPLNPNIPFKKSYITDFIRGLISTGNSIKAIEVKNGWLEVDTFQDYITYEKMFKNGTISEFFKTDET